MKLAIILFCIFGCYVEQYGKISKNSNLKIFESQKQTNINHHLFQEELSSFETSFLYSGKQMSRAHNIRTATIRINSIILEPNQIFSYNQTVGPRTFRNGFRRAKIILRGRLIEDYGGGVCQVASTLHAAALYGGLEIVETRPHSRYMNYIPPGLDSTVVYPEIDLQFKNIYNFPIMIEYKEILPGRIRVRILGSKKIFNVFILNEEIERQNHNTRIITDSTIYSGNRIIERGTNFLKIRQIIVYGSQQLMFTRQRIVTYNSSDRIIGVPP